MGRGLLTKIPRQMELGVEEYHRLLEEEERTRALMPHGGMSPAPTGFGRPYPLSRRHRRATGATSAIPASTKIVSEMPRVTNVA